VADHRVRPRKRKSVDVDDPRLRRTRLMHKVQVPAAEEPGVAGIRFPRWQWWAFWALILIFARYYYWTINPTSGPIREYGPYTLLTDAFYNHQTYLRRAPAPQLLALKDPYDPQQNAGYRLHDASLYKGRYYYYFGPGPVLLLYLPYALIMREPLPDRLGTWLFAGAAFLVACVLLKLLLTRFWPQTPRWLFYFLCTCLGFSNSFPYLLRRPDVYETAIAAGQLFILAGLYAAARAAWGAGQRAMEAAALSGAAFAAAFASRPPLVFAAGAMLWLLFLGDLPLRSRLQRFAAAVIPFTAGFLLVLFYNYVRFDSPFEFGNHYQLAGINVRKLQYFHVSIPRILENLRYSLLEPPRLHSTFPFVTLAPAPPDSLVKGIEVVAGMVWVAPLILLLGAAAAAWKKIDSARRRDWAVCTATLALLGAAWIGADAFVGATMRYQADSAAVLLVASALVIAGLRIGAKPRSAQWLTGTVIALGVLGIIVNGATGMTGYYDNFRYEAPAQYKSTAALFDPVAKVLGWFGIPP